MFSTFIVLFYFGLTAFFYFHFSPNPTDSPKYLKGRLGAFWSHLMTSLKRSALCFFVFFFALLIINDISYNLKLPYIKTSIQTEV